MVFIVIPVHNRREYTRRCLECLQAQSRRDFTTVVVDDGSSDGTSQMVRHEFPEAVLLSGDGSLWWSGATNLGAAYALQSGASHILCLNDDTVPADDFLERLMETGSQFPDALVGAAAVDASTGNPCFTGECARWLTAGFRPAGRAGQRIVEVSHAPGRGLLIPAAVFQRIGFFDAVHFPMAGADYDFTQRARRAGYRVVCDRAAVLGMHPDACGGAVFRRHKSWANYHRHLFDVRGSGNLRVFFWYALRNCPRWFLPLCLAAGLLRRLGGYPLEWLRERREARHAGNSA